MRSEAARNKVHQTMRSSFVVSWLLAGLITAGGCGGGHPDVFSHCGNGVIDTQYEECDDGDQNNDHGSCLTTCLKARCGDGFLCAADAPECAPEDVEQCDGLQLGGKTCFSFGFMSGTLACSPTCTFDTSGCAGPTTDGASSRQDN